MTIEKIDPNEIPQSARRRRGNLGEESTALLALAVGEAVKFPCRWSHRDQTGRCSGVVQFWNLAARHGMGLKPRCHEGTVYVLRVS